jgi:hypothetical protein
MIKIRDERSKEGKARTVARPMLLLMLLILSGCSEAESPRFVPAKGDAPAGSTADRKPSGEVAIPKNIPMH